MRILTAAQAREMDRHTIEDLGVPSLELMERAGTAVADVILERYPRAKKVFVACGRGNNGGDGWVVARKLAEAEREVAVFACWPREECSPDCQEMWKRAEASTIRLTSPENIEEFGPDLLVDAIYGTGFDPTRPPEQHVHDAMTPFYLWFPSVAIDIASGLDATTGFTGPSKIIANVTVTVQSPKMGMFLGEGPKVTGELVVIDIGMEESDVDGPFYVTPEDVTVVRPNSNQHKKDRGSVLCVGGSTRMPGSIFMTAFGALRAGAGLATCAVPASIQPVVAGFSPEVMTIPLPDRGVGCLTQEAAEQVLSLLPGYDFLALGPGLSRQPEVEAAVRLLVERSAIPIVLDADGLYWLAETGPLQHSSILILTPHSGEMARLLKIGSEEVDSDRFSAAEKARMDYGATVVLKGWHTVICSARTGFFAVNSTGNVGMATAGSGDVLTGVIAAMTRDTFIPSWGLNAVYIHGLAGDICLRDIGLGFTAMDIARALPQARREFEQIRGGQE